MPMSSIAADEYARLAIRATVILKADRSDLSRKEVQAIYGAAFISLVAAWNAYGKAIVRCFFEMVADPNTPKFNAIWTLAKGAANSACERFNTPNSENTRTLILASTGYDPWPEWDWPAARMSSMEVRLRLNEVLKVRHSLAHGSDVPGYTWTSSASGESRLTTRNLIWTRRLLNHLVEATDRGIRSHVRAVYGVVPAW